MGFFKIILDGNFIDITDSFSLNSNFLYLYLSKHVYYITGLWTVVHTLHMVYPDHFVKLLWCNTNNCSRKNFHRETLCHMLPNLFLQIAILTFKNQTTWNNHSSFPQKMSRKTKTQIFYESILPIHFHKQNHLW